MSAAREEILARIRAVSPTDDAPIPRRYVQTGSLGLEPRLAMFIDRLRDYDAQVHAAGESDLGEIVGRALRARGKKRLVIPSGLPAEWMPSGFEFAMDRGLSYEQLDRADGVITGCAVAVALTGTIILQHGPIEGRRALTLIPDYHLCLVRSGQVLETVPEAIQFLHSTSTRPTTAISGPSATSDIEMTRIKGVHGPRTLEVVLIRA